MTARRWAALGALALAAAGFVVVSAGGIGENLVYYWSPSELRAAGTRAHGATVRLGGQVRPSSLRPARPGEPLEFDVADAGAVVRVRARQIPPQMFREGIGVVVEGTLAADGVFESDRLMVSHGNEYRAPKTGEPVETKKLMSTTRGLEDDK